MTSITTSENVWDVAESKKTTTKLEKVASKWGLEYINMYNEWGALTCSRDFLIALVELSSMVTYEQGREILAECRAARSKISRRNARSWAISDVQSAIARAKELGYMRDSGSTPRTASRSQHPQVHEAGSDGGNQVKENDDRIQELRDSTKDIRETLAPELGETVAQTVSGATGPKGATKSPSPRPGDAAGTSFDLTGTCALDSKNTKTTPFTPLAVSCHLPPTPVPSMSGNTIPYSPPAVELARTRSSHSEPERAVEEGLVVINDGDLVLVGADLPDQSLQPISDNVKHDEWTDDDCIDALLQSFNPDPSTWFIAPTLMFRVGSTVETVLHELRDMETLPKMMLFPMRGVGAAHRTLAVFDRVRAHCLVFDAGGSQSVTRQAWATVEPFLKQSGMLQEEASAELDPFPSVRRSEDIDYGIYVMIVALHKLHGKPVDRVSPRLWRSLLAGFFHSREETSQERLNRFFADVTQSTRSEMTQHVGIEQNAEDAEALDTAKQDAQLFAQEAKFLLAITESQLQKEDRRKGLAGVYNWLLSKPENADVFVRDLVDLQSNYVVSQVETLPVIPGWCRKQLHMLKGNCSRAAVECERASLALEARRKALVEKATSRHQLLGLELMLLYQ
jgi:hypothetical protein